VGLSRVTSQPRWPAWLASCAVAASCPLACRPASQPAEVWVQPPRESSSAALPIAATTSPSIALIEPEACILEAVPFEPPVAIELRVGPATPVFAKVTYADAAVLHLPVGAGARGSVIDLDAGGVHLRAHTASRLHPRHHFVVGGALWPKSAMPLSVEDISLDHGEPRIRVSFSLPAGIHPLRHPSIVARCDQLGLTPRSLPPLPPGMAPRFYQAALRADSYVIVYAHPGGAPIATIITKDLADLAVDVHRTTHAHAHIKWEDEHLLLSGWVAQHDLDARGDQMGPEWPEWPEGSSSGRGAYTEVVQCDREAPLVVALKGARTTVGVIQPGTSIGIGAPAQGLHEVELWNTSIALVPSARWMSPHADLVDCQRVQ